MKRARNAYDIFLFLSTLCLLFTIGFHLGKDKTKELPVYMNVTVEVTKIKGTPTASAVALIDGRYSTVITDFDDGSVTLICSGSFHEAGFLLGGAKYIAKNQPINATADFGYFEGRITSIYEITEEECGISIK